MEIVTQKRTIIVTSQKESTLQRCSRRVGMFVFFNVMLLFCLSGFESSAADPSLITAWVDHGSIKVRQQGDFTGTGQQTVHNISLKCAKNEFEPFQIFIYANGETLNNVDVTVSNLTNGSDTISDILIYKEGYSTTTIKTRVDYVTGAFPNILFPKVDQFYGEKRNSFPFAVTNGTVQGVWVDLGTTASTPAGTYTGTYTITADGKAALTGSITLQVWDFTLPSTATQKNLFVLGDSQLEHGHFGTWYTKNFDWTANIEALYVKALLYARASISEKSGGVFYNSVAADGTNTFTANWAMAYKAALDGTAISSGPYAGAKLAAIDFERAHDMSGSVDSGATKNRKYLQSWWDYFTANGWDPKNRLYAYLIDEPTGGNVSYRGGTYTDYQVIMLKSEDMYNVNTGGQGRWRNSFSTENRDLIGPQASMVNATAPYLSLDTTGFWCPLMVHYEYYNPVLAASYKNPRESYPGFSNWSKENHWAYISNMNYAFPTGGLGQVDITTDSPAFWTRALGWTLWSYRTTGMLYYFTNFSSGRPEPFVNEFIEGGNGGGDLLYPGVASKVGRPALPASTPEIGGVHDIPLESIRLKLWRESQEDREYMEILRTHGPESAVDAVVDTIYSMSGVSPPSKYYTLKNNINDIFAAREALANKILALPGRVQKVLRK